MISDLSLKTYSSIHLCDPHRLPMYLHFILNEVTGKLLIHPHHVNLFCQTPIYFSVEPLLGDHSTCPKGTEYLFILWRNYLPLVITESLFNNKCWCFLEILSSWWVEVIMGSPMWSLYHTLSLLQESLFLFLSTSLVKNPPPSFLSVSTNNLH